jgi:acetylornithine/succinyldiaminopimelate/putrescine aminotransferase
MSGDRDHYFIGVVGHDPTDIDILLARMRPVTVTFVKKWAGVFAEGNESYGEDEQARRIVDMLRGLGLAALPDAPKEEK